MKNLIALTSMLLFLLLFFTGCQKISESNNIIEQKESDKATTTAELSKTTELGKSNTPPNPSIGVRSLEQLEEMRKMAESEDEEALYSYLRSVEGGGAHSREDLVNFLNLVDSLPIIELIEGKISWISHEAGYPIGGGTYYDVVDISTKAENGDWTRIEYMLSVDDVSAEMEKRKSDDKFADSILDSPVLSKDGKIRVYCETREKHVSGTGDLIYWVVDLDGIYANVIYYTNNIDDIITEDVFRDLTITTKKY